MVQSKEKLGLKSSVLYYPLSYGSQNSDCGVKGRPDVTAELLHLSLTPYSVLMSDTAVRPLTQWADLSRSLSTDRPLTYNLLHTVEAA